MVTEIRISKPDIGADETPPRQLSRLLPPVQEEENGIISVIQTSATLTQATPKGLEIGTLLDDRLRVHGAINVAMEQEGETYIARCDSLDEFGYGETPFDAIDDLRMVIAELYWTLKAESRNLSPNMVRLWECLGKLVEEK
jgi:hypothetical protein